MAPNGAQLAEQVRRGHGRSSGSIGACIDIGRSWCMSLPHPEPSCLFWLSSIHYHLSALLGNRHSVKAVPAFPHQNKALCEEQSLVRGQKPTPKSSCHHPKHHTQLEHTGGSCSCFCSMGDATFQTPPLHCWCLPRESWPHSLAGVSLSLVVQQTCSLSPLISFKVTKNGQLMNHDFLESP